jgi:hypothetical protein
LLPLLAGAAALAIGLLVRSLVDRFLEEGGPRRYYVSQSILYGDTFLHFVVGLATTPLKREAPVQNAIGQSAGRRRIPAIIEER